MRAGEHWNTEAIFVLSAQECKMDSSQKLGKTSQVNKIGAWRKTHSAMQISGRI